MSPKFHWIPSPWNGYASFSESLYSTQISKMTSHSPCRTQILRYRLVLWISNCSERSRCLKSNTTSKVKNYLKGQCVINQVYTILYLLGILLYTYTLLKIHNVLMKNHKHIRIVGKEDIIIMMSLHHYNLENNNCRTKYKKIHLHKTRF